MDKSLLITLADLKDIRSILEQTMDREYDSEYPGDLMDKINNNILYLEHKETQDTANCDKEDKGFFFIHSIHDMKNDIVW